MNLRRVNNREGSGKRWELWPRPKPGSFEIGITIKKLERCKSLGIDHILAELIHTGGNSLQNY